MIVFLITCSYHSTYVLNFHFAICQPSSTRFPLNLKNLLVWAMNAMQYKAPLFHFFKWLINGFHICETFFDQFQFWDVFVKLYDQFNCNVWTQSSKDTKSLFLWFHPFYFHSTLQKLIKYILSYFIELDAYLQERSYFYSYTLSTIYNATSYFEQKFQMQHQMCHSLFIEASWLFLIDYFQL